MNCLKSFYSPQLKVIHKGKVRDSIRVDEKMRLIAVTDRISSFDNVLNNYIPYKGAVLTGITNFWFEKTRNIIENHFIKMVDPNISLVKEAEPINGKSIGNDRSKIKKKSEPNIIGSKDMAILETLNQDL